MGDAANRLFSRVGLSPTVSGCPSPHWDLGSQQLSGRLDVKMVWYFIMTLDVIPSY